MSIEDIEKDASAFIVTLRSAVEPVRSLVRTAKALAQELQETKERNAYLQEQIKQLTQRLEDATKPVAALEPKVTIQDMAYEVLAEAGPAGLRSNAILERIREQYWPGLRRESLSAQLSRLTQAGLIQFEGKGGSYRVAPKTRAADCKGIPGT